MNIKKEEFDIPKNVVLQLDEKSQKFYIDAKGNKVTILENGKMVTSKDRNKVTFYHIVDGEYLKHTYHLKDKKNKA